MASGGGFDKDEFSVFRGLLVADAEAREDG